MSSPGLGRPLKKEKDYVRQHWRGGGDPYFTSAMDRQKEFTGILKAYDENTVTIEYEDGAEMTFERTDIALIRLAFDF